MPHLKFAAAIEHTPELVSPGGPDALDSARRKAFVAMGSGPNSHDNCLNCMVNPTYAVTREAWENHFSEEQLASITCSDIVKPVLDGTRGVTAQREQL